VPNNSTTSKESKFKTLWLSGLTSEVSSSKSSSQVKDKYLGFVENCEILLFLGTTKQFHGWASNPFVIIGVFYPQKESCEKRRNQTVIHSLRY
jgi:hypothetical protein